MIRVKIVGLESVLEKKIYDMVDYFLIEKDYEYIVEVESITLEEAISQLENINFIRADIYVFDKNILDSQKGIELARFINTRLSRSRIIFLTDKVNDYEYIYTRQVEVAAMLIKSDNKKFKTHFRHTLDVLISRIIESRNVPKIMLKCDHAYKTYLVSEIFCAKSIPAKHKISVDLEYRSEIFNENLNKLAAFKDYFFRCNRSQVVNVFKIRKIDKKNRIIELQNGQTCYYARGRGKELFELFENMYDLDNRVESLN
ncbi:MAG: LytTR family transcriptional regulator DNA-binding domain-containing protein [Clostridioides sp.]|jgi:two-component system response regulator AgrA|nr:LytTR family transcriptional regulator DNA-binding domain-containing protein [Clostridioides sp.]